MLFYVFAIVVRFVCLFHSSSIVQVSFAFSYIISIFIIIYWLFHHIYATVKQCHF